MTLLGWYTSWLLQFRSLRLYVVAAGSQRD